MFYETWWYQALLWVLPYRIVESHLFATEWDLGGELKFQSHEPIALKTVAVRGDKDGFAHTWIVKSARPKEARERDAFKI